MEYFSALLKADIHSNAPSRQRHAVFHSFLSDDSKQDTATNNAHRKRSIVLLKGKKLLTASFSTLWENTDGCTEQYRCGSAL